MTSVFVEENGETSVAAVEDTPEKKVGNTRKGCYLEIRFC